MSRRLDTQGRSTGDAPIDTPEQEIEKIAPGNALTTVGTVIAVLFAFPSSFIGIYGVITIVSGGSLLAGITSALWGYAVVIGAYELMRCKFDWDRGRKRQNFHLGVGLIAVAIAMVASAALENILFVFAVFPGRVGVNYANERYEKNYVAAIYATLLLLCFSIAVWLYSNEYQARQLAAWIEALP